jgi:outer membrane protein OmpA-like peptidoglycan-associated protein
MKQVIMCLIVCLIAFGLSACAVQQTKTVVFADECCGVKISCDDEKIVILENVMFDWDKDNIHDDQQPVIDKIVGIMDEHPDINISLEGYASTEGELEYNLDLSGRRVDSVKSALVEKGVSEDRIVDAQGMGETDIFGIELPLNRKVKVSSE